MVEPNTIDILIVEDNPADIELILYALKENNITNEVFVAKDGVSALDYMLEKENKLNKKPKLILLDLKLPFISGIEVLAKLKTNEETKSIPIIILSTSKEESDIKNCYQLGANSYIVKPVDYDEFVKVINCVSQYWLKINKTCL